ncbi:MAG TPA: magnesium/cobalt transporter CorA [Armatimonadota bacterium]|jgi:magnesium transporter
MLRCERYHLDSGRIDVLTPEQVPECLLHPETVLWVDIEAPTEDELHWVAETFAFHPLAMEDVRNQQQRAKLDPYDGYNFFVMRTLHYHPRSHRLDSEQLDIFLGASYLVTIHRSPLPAIAQARHRWEQSHLPHEAAFYLFYVVADVVVDSFFPIIDEMGDLIDDLDAQIFAQPKRELLQTLFALRRSLLTVRKNLTPLRDALNELIRSAEGGTIIPMEHTRAYINDVYDHILRQTDFVDTYRDMLSGSLDAYQSSLSNKLNENMQRLTVAATILATGTVVTGFYGMNLRGIGINSEWLFGGHLVLAILLVVTLIELWLFRRKGWI